MNSLHRLLLTGLESLYDAHHQGAKQAAATEGTSTDPGLKRALALGARANLNQAKRLEKVFKTLGAEPDRQQDAGMQGILDAHTKAATQTNDPAERDLIHIAFAQSAAHFYLAQYGTLRTYAEQLGNRKAAALLQKTLDEAAGFDKKLSALALSILAQSGPSRRGAKPSSGLLRGALLLAALSLLLSGTKISASFSLDSDPAPED